MENRKNPISEMVEDLERKTERLEISEELKEKVEMEQIDLFLKATSVVESARLKGQISQEQRNEMDTKIKDLLRERMLPNGVEYFMIIEQLLGNFSRLCKMLGVDASEHSNQYDELLDDKIKLPTHEQILNCRKYGFNKLILFPPWDRRYIVDRFSGVIPLGSDLLVPEAEHPKQFYTMATKFGLSNYTPSTDIGSEASFVDRSELEENVSRFQKEFSVETGLTAKGLTISEYLFFQLEYMRYGNADSDEFKHKRTKDNMEPCALFGEDKNTGNGYATWGFSGAAVSQIYIRQTEKDKIDTQMQKTRLGIRFDSEEND